jgi:hypothetical protein
MNQKPCGKSKPILRLLHIGGLRLIGVKLNTLPHQGGGQEGVCDLP